MLKEWQKFRGWKALEFFLENPNASSHTNEIARRIALGKSTISTYLTIYARDGLLNKRKTGNLISYSLNNESYVVKALKKFYVLQKLGETGFVQKFASYNQPVSLVLYGSYASGEYTEHSDVDILAISQSKRLDQPLLNKLEKALKKEVNLEVYAQGEWRKMVRAERTFAVSVKKNHVLLYGAEL